MKTQKVDPLKVWLYKQKTLYPAFRIEHTISFIGCSRGTFYKFLNDPRKPWPEKWAVKIEEFTQGKVAAGKLTNKK